MLQQQRTVDDVENEPPIAQLVGHTVAEVERDLIIHTLSRHCGSRTRAAGVLGLSVRTLRNKIREYTTLGIEVPAPARAESRMIAEKFGQPCEGCGAVAELAAEPSAPRVKN